MNLHFLHTNFTTTTYGQNLHNYLILARSRDVIEHNFLMTTWYPYTICYRCSIVTESVSPAVGEILSRNIWGSQHTLRHWSRDDSIPHMLFPIAAPLKPSPYLQALESYSTPNIYGSRPWPFRVTWRHRACDRLIPHIGGESVSNKLLWQPSDCTIICYDWHCFLLSEINMMIMMHL